MSINPKDFNKWLSQQSAETKDKFMPNKNKDIATKDEDFYNWLSLQSTQVQNNVKVVKQQESKYKVMLRTDKSVPETFFPIMPTSAGDGEDNTCPRICVGPTLLGCLAGYGRVASDIVDHPAHEEPTSKDFNGGYYISAFAYTHALDVNQNLVPEAPITDEHWLVGFDSDSRIIKPVNVGKCFVKGVYFSNKGKVVPGVTYELIVNVNSGNSLWLDDKVEITEGNWFVSISAASCPGGRLNGAELGSVTKLSDMEYLKLKNTSAVLLEIDSKSFPLLNW